MATDIRLKESLPEITEAIVATYTECSRTSHLGHKPLPAGMAIVDTRGICSTSSTRASVAARTCTSATSSTTSAT